MMVVDELYELLTDEERAIVDRDLKRLAPRRAGAPVPDGWENRVPLVYPRFAKAGFGDRHAEFWRWVESIRKGEKPRPFAGFWPRGGAKSTSAEMGVTDLGVRGQRTYCLYVRETQPPEPPGPTIWTPGS